MTRFSEVKPCIVCGCLTRSRFGLLTAAGVGLECPLCSLHEESGHLLAADRALADRLEAMGIRIFAVTADGTA